MPKTFRYREVFFQGRPRHQKYDDFWRRHPPMSASRWAKIYAPFDALDGFDEAIESKKVLYESRKELSDFQKEELDKKLSALHELMNSSFPGRKKHPVITIEYFISCPDTNNEWYGHGGQYKKITGAVRKMDTLVSRSILLCTGDGDLAIPLDDVISIAGEASPGCTECS